MMRNSLFGVVMLWEIDLLPFRKNVSGVQILLTIRLFSRRISIGPSNLSRSSIHVWRKNTSMVYSWKGVKVYIIAGFTDTNTMHIADAASIIYYLESLLFGTPERRTDGYVSNGFWRKQLDTMLPVLWVIFPHDYYSCWGRGILAAIAEGLGYLGSSIEKLFHRVILFTTLLGVCTSTINHQRVW